jgi:hypothetical protein
VSELNFHVVQKGTACEDVRQKCENVLRKSEGGRGTMRLSYAMCLQSTGSIPFLFFNGVRHASAREVGKRNVFVFTCAKSTSFLLMRRRTK